ncbi:hypothetical protein [Plasmodium yoelii yoelii]|uniref:Uncharacterized protein n=1 Tax=Plasmodium yoelii yoelii TaxID=73239 RepID=Q7R719_PLAYO|nr:hypothetical protein [Plasmodium yoelii yoelii]
MSTIAAADMYGLPVSTTPRAVSGVAGTMAANGSGLQWSTIPQSGHGLGVDPACRGPAFREPLLRVSPDDRPLTPIRDCR